MVKKPTIILLVLFALIGLFAWFFESSPDSKTAKLTPVPTDVSRPFENWKFENTAKIDYVDENGYMILVSRGKDMNTWSIEGDTAAQADTGKIYQLMSELLSFKPQVKLNSDIDSSAMGLNNNFRKLNLVDTNGASLTILFGSETPTKSGTYIKVGQDYYIINTPVVENIKPLLTREGLLTPTEHPLMLTQTPSP